LTGYLVLEDKTVFEGEWHGDPTWSGVGEVVFNTSMMGYQEIITDPSYFQQIIVMTTPEQGNYGVAVEERESKVVHAEAFVCVELNTCAGRKGRHNLIEELGAFGRPALSDVDTRSLTLHLRSNGTPWGAVVSADSTAMALEKALPLISTRKKLAKADWPFEVSVKERQLFKGQGKKGRVAVLDFGTKGNIVRELQARFAEVGVFNSRTASKEILDWNPEGVVLTNGPGDPAGVEKAVGEIRVLLGQVPIFGICMGHQLLALAAGGKTFKLKFGHRGANHPVKNLATGEIYMTSQNHGYAVDENLPSNVKVSQINLYDQTVEGLEFPTMKAWSVQYHPEANPGPHDSRVLFDYFAKNVL
jgi:carbamoyl-phosphate synthase small subunit